MKIAYIQGEDNPNTDFTPLLKEYYAEHGQEITLDIFDHPGSLFYALEEKNYDMVILSTEYPACPIYDDVWSSLDIESNIKSHFRYMPILLLDWSKKPQLECRLHLPQRYMLNKLSKENITGMMDNVTGQLRGYPSGTIHVKAIEPGNRNAFGDKSTSSDRMIPIKNIMFARVDKRIITIRLYSGEEIQTLGPMKKFCKKLLIYPEFTMPHTSFIVNMTFISKITPKFVYLKSNTEEIPIAKGKAGLVKNEYQSYFSSIHFSPEIIERRMPWEEEEWIDFEDLDDHIIYDNEDEEECKEEFDDGWDPDEWDNYDDE